MTLRDPDTCPRCSEEGRIINSRRVEARIVKGQPIIGYRKRRHQCRVCAFRWSSWDTIINPRRLRPIPPVVVPAS